MHGRINMSAIGSIRRPKTEAMKRFAVMGIPYIAAGVVESYYGVSNAATWWLAAIICLAMAIGSWCSPAQNEVAK